MKPEHDEVIEAMRDAMCDDTFVTPEVERALESALRAAAERGYRLAKLPTRFLPELSDKQAGWNACLDAIETIELEEK